MSILIPQRRSVRAPVLAGFLLLCALGCAESEPAVETARGGPGRNTGPETVRVEIGGESFDLELAIDPETRMRGLGGRLEIGRNAGMLFVDPASRPQAMVMRDCPIAIDVAFLDETGRVVALHAMQPEAPRGPGESWREYEDRLPKYESGGPARFAVETAGGRFAELGVAVGDRLVFESRNLLQRARRNQI